MTPQEFIKKYQLDLSQNELELIQEGYQLMLNSMDPLHSDQHVLQLLKILDDYLAHAGEQIQVDLKKMLVGIVWHDTWKSQRYPRNAWHVFWDQVWDGMGSMLLFRKRTTKYQLAPRFNKDVQYMIRKHAKFQTFPRWTKEARLLSDCDRLAEWDYNRLGPVIEKYLNGQEKATRAEIYAAKFYVYWFMEKRSDRTFYLPWFKQQFHSRRDAVLKKIWAVIAEGEALMHSK